MPRPGFAALIFLGAGARVEQGSAMRRLLLCGMFPGMLLAQQSFQPPSVAEVISETIESLPAPGPPAVPKLPSLAVTTSSQDAQQQVSQGMLCLHAGWDFEAYRHFCAALQADPFCLMAHWGATLTLLQAEVDLRDEREAAVERMLNLADRDTATDLEKRYVFALVKLMSEGVGEASNAFAAIVKEYPNDPQAALFSALFSRSGYDEFGSATPDQERAEAMLRERVERHPDQPYLLHALLAIRAEAPALAGDLEAARKLVEMAPDFPPYQHLLGHYAWRCGHHAEAGRAFARASELFEAWMAETGLSALHCPGWARAESYRAVALASRGLLDEALAVAEALAAVEVPAADANKPGARMLLWEGRTLPARVRLRRARAGDMKAGIDSLPGKDAGRAYAERSLAVWSWQSHVSVLALRQALENGSLDDARAMSESLTMIGENLVGTGETAMATGERSPWMRLFKGLEVMASECRGLISMADDRSSAFNWYRSAVDRQEPATLMMPPMVLLPMEVRLAEYFIAGEEWSRAEETLDAGDLRRPNDAALLATRVALLEKSGRGDEAAPLRERLASLRDE